MKKLLAIILYPLSIIYGIITLIRNFLFNTGILKSKKYNTPIICVGNITVGGTGKTPHVEYLIENLQKKYKVAVISRGYKRKTKGFLWVTKDCSPAEVGDEPLQIATKFENIIVTVDENRKRGIEILENIDNPPNLIIMDDGYQHRRVKAGIYILLTDYNHPIYKDTLLPSGRLRERKNEKRRATVIFATKTPKKEKPIQKSIFLKKLNPYPFQKVYFSSLDYSKKLYYVFKKNKSIQIEDIELHNKKIIGLTGIANPILFQKKIAKLSPNCEFLTFRDHYNFKEKDIEKINSKLIELGDEAIIITTEKDAIRLKEFEASISKRIKERYFYIPIKVKIKDSDSEELIKMIDKYIETGREPGKLVR